MRLTNYYEHAGDNRFYVFEFIMDEHADEFEGFLVSRQVKFERFFDVDDTGKHLFGISRQQLRDAMWCNNMVHARHRRPFIPNNFFKWFLLLFTSGMILLAVLGYLKSA